jgi:hypothetical protein
MRDKLMLEGLTIAEDILRMPDTEEELRVFIAAFEPVARRAARAAEALGETLQQIELLRKIATLAVQPVKGTHFAKLRHKRRGGGEWLVYEITRGIDLTGQSSSVYYRAISAQGELMDGFRYQDSISLDWWLSEVEAGRIKPAPYALKDEFPDEDLERVVPMIAFLAAKNDPVEVRKSLRKQSLRILVRRAKKAADLEAAKQRRIAERKQRIAPCAA